MKRIACLVVVGLMFTACQKRVSAADLTKINGYWEIEKVVFPNGDKKNYTINEVYDYFEIRDNKGFRKKVTPQLDGTFLVDNTDEKVTITEQDGVYRLNYLTAYAKWEEELVAVSDKELVTKNNSKKEYHYKRTQPINILPHGKKAQ